MPNWYADLSLKAVIDRERVEADPRPDIGDYTLVNLSLRRKNIGGMLDVALTVRNLFGADAREPSVSAVSISNDIPNDIPLADRNLYGELRVRF